MMPVSLERPAIRSAPLSVLLLAHQATAEPRKTIESWCLELDALARDYELFLVAAEPTATPPTTHPRVKVLPCPGPVTPGAALRCGLAAAQHPLLLTCDCTDPFRPNDLKLLLERINAVDVVSAYPVTAPVPGWLHGVGVIFRKLVRVVFGMPLDPLPGWDGWRGWCYRWLARLGFGVRLYGVGSSFRLYRRAIFARIPIQSDGEFAYVEIVAKANFLGCLMDEVIVPGRTMARQKAPSLLKEAYRLLRDPDFGPAVLPEPTLVASDAGVDG